MKYEGRLLNLGTVDKCDRKFSEDCIIDFPDKVPVTFNFRSGLGSVLGVAEVSRDEKGLGCNVVFHHESFTDGSYYVGGRYDHVRTHMEGSITVIDSCRLIEMSITLDPADENLKIVRCEEE